MDSSQSSQGSGGMLEMSVGSHRVFLPPECPTFLEMDIITESTITGDEEITESVDFPRGMTLYDLQVWTFKNPLFLALDCRVVH